MKYPLGYFMGPARRLLTGILVVLHVVGPVTRALGVITPVWSNTNRASEASKAVIIEAEEVSQLLDSSDWLAASTEPGFHGHGYLDHRNRGGVRGGQTPLLYHFHLENAGDYLIALRGRHTLSEERPPATVDLRLETGFRGRLRLPPAGSWQDVATTKAIALDAGTHELRLQSVGSEPFAIDQILIYPVDEGLPEQRVSSKLLYSREFDDLEPPTPPRNLRVKGHGCAHLHLIWDGSEDAESAVLAYDIYWRRRWLARSFRPEYVLGQLEPYSLYHINVQAIDLGGNASRESRVIVETGEFTEANGLRITPSPSDGFVLDGKQDPLWERHRSQPLQALSSSEDEAQPLDASFRLAWNERQLSLLIDTPPIQAPRIKIDLDSGLTQEAFLNERHRSFDLPLNPLEPNAKQAPASSAGAHSVTSTKGDGRHVFEISIPWLDPRASLASKRARLLGMNLSVWEAADPALPLPVLAWRWDEEKRLPTTSPYQFGVIELAHALSAGNPESEMPPNIWRARDGYAIIEVEDIECDSAWRTRTSPKGHLGEGFLQWNCPPHHPTVAAETPVTEDFTTAYQGSQERWIVARVYTDRPGLHAVQVRFKQNPNEAQRVWVGRVGQPVGPRHPVRSLGIAKGPDDAFDWSTSTVTLPLRQGVNNLYLCAATQVCEVDRIAIYAIDAPQAKEKALDPGTFASQAFR